MRNVQCPMSRASYLLFEYLLDIANLLLHFAGVFVSSALSLEILVTGQIAGGFLDSAFDLSPAAFNFVCGAVSRFHIANYPGQLRFSIGCDAELGVGKLELVTSGVVRCCVTFLKRGAARRL